MASFLPKIALIGAAFATGSFLRSSNVLSKQDANVNLPFPTSPCRKYKAQGRPRGVSMSETLSMQAATLALTYGTLPSLALQNLLT